MLDEINRTDFDKRAAELMAILGSEEYKIPESLILELTEAAKLGCDEARKALEMLEQTDYRLPKNVLFIATMNSFDAAALFRLGFATFRRFNVIEIAWSRETIRKFIEKVCSKLLERQDENMARIVGEASSLLNDLVTHGGEEIINALQPGILQSFFNIIKNLVYTKPEIALKAAFRETLLHQLRAVTNESERHKISEILRRYGLEDLELKLRLLWELAELS